MNKYIVVYRCSNQLYSSPIFDDYDDALAFTTSDEGAGDEKAIIIKIENICQAQPCEISIEDHT